MILLKCTLKLSYVFCWALLRRVLYIFCDVSNTFTSLTLRRLGYLDSNIIVLGDDAHYYSM